MNKPTMYTTTRHPMWGAPQRVPTYNTSKGYHITYEQWAKHKSLPVLNLALEFHDDSSDPEFHRFDRVKKEVSYGLPWEDETYNVEVDTSKFDSDFLSEFILDNNSEHGVSASQLKSALRGWIDKHNLGNVKFKWTYVKD